MPSWQWCRVEDLSLGFGGSIPGFGDGFWGQVSRSGVSTKDLSLRFGGQDSGFWGRFLGFRGVALRYHG